MVPNGGGQQRRSRIGSGFLLASAITIAATLSASGKAYAHHASMPAALPFPFPSPQAFVTPGDGPSRMVPGYSIDLRPGRAFDASTHEGRYFRAGIEILAALGAGTALYWAGREWNSMDWDVSWNLPSWRKKLITLEAVTFDTNHFEVNAVGHPAAGVVYYQLARSNSLSAAHSFLFAAAGSTLWEYVAEFRENVSINDLISTPIGGMALGETFFQLGVFFNRGANTLSNKILATLFAPSLRFHQSLDGRAPARANVVDSLGFPRDVWHRFTLYGGIGTTRRHDGSGAAVTPLGLHTEMITIAGYERPGRVSRTLGAGSLSGLSARASMASDGLFGLQIRSKAGLCGYYLQDLRPSPSGHLEGYGALFGLSIAFDYARQDWPDGYRDKIGVVSMPGPTVDLKLYHPVVIVRATLDAHGHFAGVRSPVIPQYSRMNGSSGIKHVLIEKGYYFGAGITLHPQLSIQHRGLTLGGEVKFDSFYSIQGRDRFQHRVTNDFPLSDQRLNSRFWIRYAPQADGPARGDMAPGSWVSAEHVIRSGRIGILRKNFSETRFQAGMSVLF